MLVVVFTLVQGWSLPWVARRLRIAAPVTPRDVEVESAPLDELDADLMQLTVPQGSRLHGVYLPELRLPEDAAVVLIVRDGPVVRARTTPPGSCAATRRCWCRPAAPGRRPSAGCGRSAAPAAWPCWRGEEGRASEVD